MSTQNCYNNPVEDAGSGAVVLDSDEQDDYEDPYYISVPLTITMLVIAGYVIIGALLFAAWENWSLLSVS